MLQVSLRDTYNKYVPLMMKCIHYSVSVSIEREKNGGKKRKLMIESLQETSVCGHSLVQMRWGASVLKVKYLLGMCAPSACLGIDCKSDVGNLRAEKARYLLLLELVLLKDKAKACF